VAFDSRATGAAPGERPIWRYGALRSRARRPGPGRRRAELLPGSMARSGRSRLNAGRGFASAGGRGGKPAAGRLLLPAKIPPGPTTRRGSPARPPGTGARWGRSAGIGRRPGYPQKPLRQMAGHAVQESVRPARWQLGARDPRAGPAVTPAGGPTGWFSRGARARCRARRSGLTLAVNNGAGVGIPAREGSWP
jgi:hypothetical protein